MTEPTFGDVVEVLVPRWFRSFTPWVIAGILMGMAACSIGAWDPGNEDPIYVGYSQHRSASEGRDALHRHE